MFMHHHSPQCNPTFSDKPRDKPRDMGWWIDFPNISFSNYLSQRQMKLLMCRSHRGSAPYLFLFLDELTVTTNGNKLRDSSIHGESSYPSLPDQPKETRVSASPNVPPQRDFYRHQLFKRNHIGGSRLYLLRSLLGPHRNLDENGTNENEPRASRRETQDGHDAQSNAHDQAHAAAHRRLHRPAAAVYAAGDSAGRRVRDSGGAAVVGCPGGGAAGAGFNWVVDEYVFSLSLFHWMGKVVWCGSTRDES